MGHEEVLGIIAPEKVKVSLEPLTDGWQEWKDAFIREVLPLFGVKSPPQPRVGLETAHDPDPYDHLLETCRWATRFAFIREVFGDASRASLATYDWHRLFPAVVGHDVTLARRTELIEWIDDFVAADSTPSICRDAAVFWMALLVLTDVEAFGDWSDQTLTLMLATDDPPMSHTGDVWMRALDLLIALAPEENHAELTAPLAGDAMLLRRALRQRVRGIHHHFELVAREIESLDSLGDHASAGAMWADLKRVVDLLEDVAQAREIHEWLARRMGRWMMGESATALHYSMPGKFAHDFAYGLLLHPSWQIRARQDDQAALLERALEALDQSSKPAPHLHMAFPIEFTHALRIATLLDEEARADIHNRAGLLIAWRLPKLMKNVERRQIALRDVAGTLEMVMDDLDGETLEVLKQTIFEWCLFHEEPKRFSGREMWRTAVVLDAASREPSLTAAERIALWQLGTTWVGKFPQRGPEDVAEFFKIFTSEEPPERFQDWFEYLKRGRNLRILSYNQLHFRGMLHEMVTPHELPLRFESSLYDHGGVGLERRGPYYEPWQPISREPEIVSGLLEGIDLNEYRDHHHFMEFLMDYPLLPETRRVIVEYLKDRLESDDRHEKTTAFHWLLQFSHWLDEDERVAFRKRFHRFFRSVRIGIEAWQRRYIHYDALTSDGVRMYRGEQIPWEGDALSSEFSWSSSIHHDLAILPWRAYQDPTVFRHLHASGCSFVPGGWGPAELRFIPIDEIAADLVFRDEVPCPREVVTPWQSARALHLRRPDLKFPDRPIFRPMGSRVHFQRHLVIVDP